MNEWSLDEILSALKGLESGGNYTARSKVSSASGAYQWIRSTWNGYGGYAEAWQAPPAVQERRAREDMARKLKSYGGDVRKAIMSWFYPAAVGNAKVANSIIGNNTITPNQYVEKVMRRLGGAGMPTTTTEVADGGQAPVVDAKPDQAQALADFMGILMDPSTETQSLG